MDLSVIIVSYNVKHFLKQCLFSVKKASENIDYEIFVVDNNSADGSCSMVRTEFPGVKLIMNNVNRGFSAANNQALKMAGGRFILLLNPDTIVEEDTFTRCISFMNEHNEAGAMGVRMIDGRGRVLPESKRALPTPGTAFYKIFGLSYIFPRSRIFNRYYLSHIDDHQTAKVDILSGAFMFLRHEAVDKTGLLDEEFFMYGEDVDYSYRLVKAGFVNYYYPEIRIIHYKGQSTKKENLNVLINFYRAMLIFVRKHFSNGRLKGLTFLIKAAIFFRAGISLIQQIFKRLLHGITGNIFSGPGKTIIISEPQGYQVIIKLLALPGIHAAVAGRVSLNRDDASEEVLGNLEQLREIIRINKIKEVIFAAGEMSTSQIIKSMHNISDLKIKTKIASSDGKYIISSRHVSHDGRTIFNSDC
jgi:GT2 family glycosyltransferase